MSKPSGLSMREFDVCLDCERRVGTWCRCHRVPVKWNVRRYGCDGFVPRDSEGVRE